MMKQIVTKMAKYVNNERGVSEIVQNFGLIIVTCVIVVAVATIMVPSMDGGVATVTGRIASTWTTLGGL